MKSKKSSGIVIFIACLVAVTAVIAVIHITTRTKVKEGTILITTTEKNYEISFDNLKTEPVEGTVQNAKGDIKTISGEGARLEELFLEAGVMKADSVTVYADDEYSAVVMGEEIEDPAKVYMMIEDGMANLVVFGDPDSKRNVTNVVRIVVE